MSRRWERLIWAGAALAATASVVGWIGGRPRTSTASSALAASVGPSVQVTADDSIGDAAAAASDHDLFRLTREPSSIPYAADNEGAPPPAAPPKPTLVLSGIVGPPWVAIVDGVPGRAGSILAKAGDTVSRAPGPVLIVRKVMAESAVVVGADTTWRLTVHRTWP